MPDLYDTSWYQLTPNRKPNDENGTFADAVNDYTNDVWKFLSSNNNEANDNPIFDWGRTSIKRPPKTTGRKSAKHKINIV